LTKLGTGRIQDQIDIEWLDSRIFPVLSRKLETCSLDEADAIFTRVTDVSLLDSAMKNPDPIVRSLAVLLRKKMPKKNRI